METQQDFGRRDSPPGDGSAKVFNERLSLDAESKFAVWALLERITLECCNRTKIVTE